MRYAKDGLKLAAFILGMAFLFTWLGVYNSNDMPFYKAYVFWATTIAVGTIASALVAPYLWGPRFEHWPSIAKIIAVSALVSLPVTVTLSFFNSGNHDYWSQPLSWVIQFGYVMVISLVLTTIIYFWSSYRQSKTATHNSEAGPDPIDTFLERLPIKYRGAQLYAVSSEDHYLRVHTDRGEELILMRLADAVRELGAAEGLQTHRSWWVAKDGVTESKRDNGKFSLLLKSGSEAPVSRTYQSAVKEAGLT